VGGWLVGRSVGWLVGLVGWSVGWSGGWSVGRLVGLVPRSRGGWVGEWWLNSCFQNHKFDPRPIPPPPPPPPPPPATQRYRLWAKQQHTWGTYTADHTMTIFLGLAFCCISPLITPFCLLYFALAAMAQRYQLLYVLAAPYQAAGRMWMNVGGRVFPFGVGVEGGGVGGCCQCM